MAKLHEMNKENPQPRKEENHSLVKWHDPRDGRGRLPSNVDMFGGPLPDRFWEVDELGFTRYMIITEDGRKVPAEEWGL